MHERGLRLSPFGRLVFLWVLDLAEHLDRFSRAVEEPPPVRSGPRSFANVFLEKVVPILVKERTGFIIVAV